MIFDMHGKEIKKGQTVEVFCTSGGGEFTHNFKAEVIIGIMGDFQLQYKELLYGCEQNEINQYPLDIVFCSQYNTLSFYFNDLIKKNQLYIPDSYGENTLMNHKWKRYGKSLYIQVMEDPE